MPKPIVTVILPAKDAGAFIGTTLTTLARQFDDPSRLRLVAIDDGSRDDTGAQMLHYGERFDHVQVIANTDPVGLAAARNQGIARVDTEYFCFVDGDDWMQPGRLEALIDTMRDLECDFVRTDHLAVTDAQRRHVRAPYPWRGIVSPARNAILPAEENSMVDYPYAWAGMFHRRVIDEGLAEFPAGLHTAEDRPWIWRLHLSDATFAVVDAPAILYRRGVSTSLTQVFDRRQLDFVPALAQAYELVDADRDADLYRPKIVATILAICSHHLFRARAMSAPHRAELRTGLRELLRPIPASELDAALARLSDRRRRLLARTVREVRRA
ncbi:glycosyltransferase involved in cell wall biosynthesis [Microbacterium marinum]|uniref:Glycosyltransferase involved in cell wall biosynthesis n=1 Tax=Microbacterium marinum TaxID=421115 RepID=A0A7W7BMU0_9MICO|nr:glycosyltransferase involved in cell wall biosynthesis [Microbacterium marinum]